MVPSPEKTPKVRNWISKIISFLKTGWKTIGAIAGLITALIGIYNFWFKSDKKTFEEKNVISGDLEAPKISSTPRSEEPVNKTIHNKPSFLYDTAHYNYPIITGIVVNDFFKEPFITVESGQSSEIIPPDSFKTGITIFTNLFNGCQTETINLIVKDDRLYASAKFIDFETEHEMGEMSYNHWTLYQKNLLNYRSAADRLEIIDNYGNIAFSLRYTKIKMANGANITIAGYFISSSSVLVLNNRFEFASADPAADIKKYCFSKSEPYWRQNAKIAMGKIVSTFSK